METLSQDLRYALRQLSAARGLTALAILTLALGIGSNTALFTAVESVLLRPLPYAHADRLTYIGPRQATPSFDTTSWLNYRDIRDQANTFQAVGGFISDIGVLKDKQGAKTVVTVKMTPNMFSLLGIQPILGRTFTKQEGVANGPSVAVLSESLWRDDFHSNPGVIGRSVEIGNVPHTIVGVMPAAFRFPDQGVSEMKDGLWLPLQPFPEMLKDRGYDFMAIVGQRRAGVTLAQAQAELNIVAQHIRKSDTSGDTRLELQAAPYQQLITGSVRPAFYALLGALALVLLIACANVANLLIARCLGRKQEFAVRVALGAPRSRLVQQLLTEGALLSLFGCIGGMILAKLALTLMHDLPSGTIPRAPSIAMHWPVLLALAVIATVTTILSSLLPALLAARTDPQTVLQASGRGMGLRAGDTRLSRWMVIGEVALSSLLLIGTGLLFHTLWNLEHTQLGFDSDNITTFTATPDDSRGFASMAVTSPNTAKEKSSVATLSYAPALERIRHEPGVESAALMTRPPFSGINIGSNFDIVGQPKNTVHRNTRMTAVSADYASTMNIAMLRGRMIGHQDASGSPYVAVINESLAKKFSQAKTLCSSSSPLAARTRAC